MLYSEQGEGENRKIPFHSQLSRQIKKNDLDLRIGAIFSGITPK